MALRNEDYTKLQAFYSNPDRFIENTGEPGEYDRYQWKDGSNTLKKAIKRFYKETGNSMDPGVPGDIYLRGGLNLGGYTGETWANGTNGFFSDFENYDRTSELIKENNAKKKAAAKASTPEPTQAEEKKEPTPEILEAVERVKSFADKRDLTPGSNLFNNMRSNDEFRFDVEKKEPEEINPFEWDKKIIFNN